MKIDTSLLNQGPNLSWGNERQIPHENLTKKSDNMDTIDSTRLEAVTRGFECRIITISEHENGTPKSNFQ